MWNGLTDSHTNHQPPALAIALLQGETEYKSQASKHGPETTMDKPTIINIIRKFIAQRSGFDWRNYMSSGSDTAGRAALRSDYSRILRHGRDARAMLRAVEMSSITAETIAERLSTGGRLCLVGERLDYTTGQYFPTEYRAAVCSLLSSLLIDHYGHNNATDERKPLARARDWASRNVGRGVAARWFT